MSPPVLSEEIISLPRIRGYLYAHVAEVMKDRPHSRSLPIRNSNSHQVFLNSIPYTEYLIITWDDKFNGWYTLCIPSGYATITPAFPLNVKKKYIKITSVCFRPGLMRPTLCFLAHRTKDSSAWHGPERRTWSIFCNPTRATLLLIWDKYFPIVLFVKGLPLPSGWSAPMICQIWLRLYPILK